MNKICETCQAKYSTTHGKQRYCGMKCIPSEQKAAAARKRAAKYGPIYLARRFGNDLLRLPVKTTREDVLAMFQEIYWRGYRAGHRALRRERAA